MANIPCLAGYQTSNGEIAPAKFGGSDVLTDPNNIPLILNAGNTPQIQAGLLASRPAAGNAGHIYIQTDSPYDIFRDSGAAWIALSAVYGNTTAVVIAYAGSGVDGRLIFAFPSAAYAVWIINPAPTGLVIPSWIHCQYNAAAGAGPWWYSPTNAWNFHISTGALDSLTFVGANVYVGITKVGGPQCNTGGNTYIAVGVGI